MDVKRAIYIFLSAFSFLMILMLSLGVLNWIFAKTSGRYAYNNALKTTLIRLEKVQNSLESYREKYDHFPSGNNRKGLMKLVEDKLLSYDEIRDAWAHPLHYHPSPSGYPVFYQLESYGLGGRNGPNEDHFIKGELTIGKITDREIDISAPKNRQVHDFTDANDNDLPAAKKKEYVQYLLRWGKKYLEKKMYISSSQQFKRAREFDKKNLSAWLGEAKVRMKNEDLSGANRALHKITSELDPKNSEAWFLRGVRYKKLGNYDDADWAFAKADKYR